MSNDGSRTGTGCTGVFSCIGWAEPGGLSTGNGACSLMLRCVNGSSSPSKGLAARSGDIKGDVVVEEWCLTGVVIGIGCDTGCGCCCCCCCVGGDRGALLMSLSVDRSGLAGVAESKKEN